LNIGASPILSRCINSWSGD